ncbi:MAG: beta-ketoacyl synthase N-terminal-like domain-containing protein [Phycisphaerales bacterium]
MSQAIAITGTGLVTALGLDRETTWRAVCAGECGVRTLTGLEQALETDMEGAEAPALSSGAMSGMPREVRYLNHAITQALAEASPSGGLPYPPSRCGIILGTTLHGMRAAGRSLRANSLQPLEDFLATSIVNLALGDLDLRGMAITTCAACASGLSSIGLAMTMLRQGELDFVIAGGYDVISEYSYAGFASLRLVAKGPLQPFAHGRKGMKLGEGYGIVVLERAEDARGRHAKPLALVRGFGASADAHHLTHPHPDGEGAASAIKAALMDAALTVEQIGMIAAHATGTEENDSCEYAAVSRAFGDQLKNIPMVAFKSHLGHTLGGAGAVELILSLCALRDQIVPPTANLRDESLEFRSLQLISKPGFRIASDYSMNLSFGFGGSNACMILMRPPSILNSGIRTHARAHGPPEEVVITGVGVVVPGAASNDAFKDLIFGCDTTTPLAVDIGPISDETLAALLNARRVRRMSEYVKLTLAAGSAAWQDAGIADPTQFADACPAILGTTHGSATLSHQFYEQIIREGIMAANPVLFAESVPNSGAAHLSLSLSLKQECQTIIGSRTAGLEALTLAAARIASGQWERALVGAADEYATITQATYQHFGLCNDQDQFRDGQFRFGCGAAMLVLESRSAAESRGARIRGTIHRCANARAAGRGPPSIMNAYCQVIREIESPPNMMMDGNDTWLHRAALAAIRKETGSGRTSTSTHYHRTGECFSAAPLLGLIAVLLGGRLPGVSASGSDPNLSFGVLAGDYFGLAAGVSASVAPTASEAAR